MYPVASPYAPFHDVPLAAHAPTTWGTPGGAMPVMIASPAATTATAWMPQPVTVPQQSLGASLIDAIADSIMGPATPAATAPGDAAMATATLGMSPSAPAAAVQPVVQPLPQPAHQPVAVVAPPPAAAAPTIAPAGPAESVGSALAGFASATGRSVSGVAGAGLSRARRVGSEVWAGIRSPRAVHVTQVPSKYNPKPAANNKDCGPTSVVMSLRLIGAGIPGMAANAAPQKLVNRVRQLAGNVSNTASTTNIELERALRAAGAKVREIADFGSIRQAVLAGKPVILNGNPRNAGAYGSRFSPQQMTPYDGAHWIVVSGFDSRTGQFIVNDPLSKIGPVKISPSQLEAYRGGSLGIEVAA